MSTTQNKMGDDLIINEKQQRIPSQYYEKMRIQCSATISKERSAKVCAEFNQMRIESKEGKLTQGKLKEFIKNNADLAYGINYNKAEIEFSKEGKFITDKLTEELQKDDFLRGVTAQSFMKNYRIQISSSQLEIIIDMRRLLKKIDDMRNDN